MKSSNVTATIKELEAERARIDAAIVALRLVSGSGPAANGNGGGLTVVSAAIAHLRKVGKPQTSKEMREAVIAGGVKATPGSIQTILAKRARLNRDLVKKGRGLWGVK